MNKNSKIEDRNSKQIRSPKYKIRSSPSKMKEFTEFHVPPLVDEESFWADGGRAEDFVLHDGPSDRKQQFDLEERTAQFGEIVIAFAKKIPGSAVNNRLISQLVGAGTSIGANYCEANDC